MGIKNIYYTLTKKYTKCLRIIRNTQKIVFFLLLTIAKGKSYNDDDGIEPPTTHHNPSSLTTHLNFFHICLDLLYIYK